MALFAARALLYRLLPYVHRLEKFGQGGPSGPSPGFRGGRSRRIFVPEEGLPRRAGVLVPAVFAAEQARHRGVASAEIRMRN